MTEIRKPTPEQVSLGGLSFTRSQIDGASWVDYIMDGEHRFHLQTYKTHGQIGGGWNTNKGVGYFLGIVNKQIDQIDPSEFKELPLSLDVRSTKSEENPNTTNFFGQSIDIPFHSYDFEAPLTLDDLESVGHYSYEENSPTKLSFLRVNTPHIDYTLDAFNPLRVECGAITTLDMSNWNQRIKLLAEYMNGTFSKPDFINAEEILKDIMRIDYPNAVAANI